MSGHQQLTALSQLPQETDPDTDRFLGIMVERIVPIGAFEMIVKHGITEERHPLAAGRQTDDAVPRCVTAGATDDDSRRHFVLLIEQFQLAAILVQEPRGDRS